MDGCRERSGTGGVYHGHYTILQYTMYLHYVGGVRCEAVRCGARAGGMAWAWHGHGQGEGGACWTGAGLDWFGAGLGWTWCLPASWRILALRCTAPKLCFNVASGRYLREGRVPVPPGVRRWERNASSDDGDGTRLSDGETDSERGGACQPWATYVALLTRLPDSFLAPEEGGLTWVREHSVCLRTEEHICYRNGHNNRASPLC